TPQAPRWPTCGPAPRSGPGWRPPPRPPRPTRAWATGSTSPRTGRARPRPATPSTSTEGEPMKLVDSAILLAWSSPFARWQGPLAELSSLDLAVDVTARALSSAGLDTGRIGSLVLGMTVPQHTSFYAGPTVAARLGLDAVTGPVIAQACATSAAVVQAAATQVE